MIKLQNIITLILVMGIVVTCGVTANAEKQKQVVLYTALDQIFSEPIVKDFERQTGIIVKVVYDTEAAKTTGLVNRLIAEKDNPNADVFWNNEIARSILLKDKGLLAPYVSAQAKDIPKQFKDKDGFWTGFAARARVLIYNKGLVADDELPKSIFDLTDLKWNNKFALGNPLFGTTATHCAALFVALGDEKAKQYFKALEANAAVMVPGNSVSRDRVVEGELAAGFTDTDDAWAAITQGKNVNMIYPDAGGMGTLLIPNTICLIKNSPHPDAARKLIDYILSREVEQKLAFLQSMQIPLRKLGSIDSNNPAQIHLSISEDIEVFDVSSLDALSPGEYVSVDYVIDESGNNSAVSLYKF